MNILIIVLAVVVVAVLVALLALNPVIAKKSQAAVDHARAKLGGSSAVLALDSRAVGFASEPEEAGAVRGQGCLAANESTLLFVSTGGQKEYAIARSAITKVDTSGDPRAHAKATVLVTYEDPDHGEVTASWRLTNPVIWLKLLGYDYGPEGPPEDEPDTP
jgi:hypothetical protein